MKLLPTYACIIGTLILAASAVAQTPAVAVQPATLSFQNREIVTLRAPRGLFSPSDRVAAAGQRLREALRTAGPGEVSVATVDNVPTVTMGGAAMFSILPGDIEAGLTGRDATAAAAAAAAGQRLTEALTAWSEDRKWQVILRGALYSVISFAVALTMIAVILRIRGAVVRWLDAQTRERLGRKAIMQGVDLMDPLIKLLHLLVNLGRVAAVAAIIYTWLAYAFSNFPLTAPWGSQLALFLGNAVLTVASGFLNGIPTMLIAVLILTVTKLFTQVVKALFDAIEDGRLIVRAIHPDTADATRRIAVVLVWVFGIAIAFPFIPGSDSEAFKGVSVLFGLMVTLGSSGVISQAMSGLVVVFSRAIKEQEYVRIGEFEGTVTEVGALSTKIRTIRNEEITIPNSVLVSSPTHNYSRLAKPDGVILTATVGIGYDAPWRKVHEALIEAARRTTGLMQTPPPFVRQKTLSTFCVEYGINAYLGLPETRLAVLSELHANIQDCCNENEIQIMTPAFEAQPPTPLVVPKSKWFTAGKQPQG